MEFIQREVYFLLKDHLNNPEISLILGPRQAGKTTLMEKLAQELKDIIQLAYFRTTLQ